MKKFDYIKFVTEHKHKLEEGVKVEFDNEGNPLNIHMSTKDLEGEQLVYDVTPTKVGIFKRYFSLKGNSKDPTVKSAMDFMKNSPESIPNGEITKLMKSTFSAEDIKGVTHIAYLGSSKGLSKKLAYVAANILGTSNVIKIDKHDFKAYRDWIDWDKVDAKGNRVMPHKGLIKLISNLEHKEHISVLKQMHDLEDHPQDIKQMAGKFYTEFTQAKGKKNKENILSPIRKAFWKHMDGNRDFKHTYFNILKHQPRIVKMTGNLRAIDISGMVHKYNMSPIHEVLDSIFKGGTYKLLIVDDNVMSGTDFRRTFKYIVNLYNIFSTKHKTLTPPNIRDKIIGYTLYKL